jgi:hypothetical protein
MSGIGTPIDGDLNLYDLRLPEQIRAQSQPARVRPSVQMKKFLRGPVPWTWLSVAAQLPGKALHVALIIRFLDGFKQTGIVSLSPARLKEFSVSRWAGYRALDALAGAGLVNVERHPGRAAKVTICEMNDAVAE